MVRILNRTPMILVCLLALWATSVPAKTDIVVLVSSDTKPYQDVVAGIRSGLASKKQQYSLTITTLAGLQAGEQALPPEHTLLLTVGTRATRYALDKKVSDTIFATFVTRSSLLPEPAFGNEFPKQLKGALVLDQPAERVVALSRLVRPKMQKLGFVVNGSAPNRQDEFSDAALKTGLQFSTATLFEDSNPIADLKAIFSSSDVFVVVPDKARFNSKIAKWVLFLSYRHRVPVIGYSKKYTDAGALVSLFSNPEQIGRDTGERVREWLTDRRRLFFSPRLLSPRYFTLTVNDKVVDSLALEIDSAEQLKQRLMDKPQFDTADSEDDPELLLRSD